MRNFKLAVGSSLRIIPRAVLPTECQHKRVTATDAIFVRAARLAWVVLAVSLPLLLNAADHAVPYTQSILGSVVKIKMVPIPAGSLNP